MPRGKRNVAVQLVPPGDRETRKAKLKNAVMYFYDLQKLRIQSGQRNSGGADDAALDDLDKAFLEHTSEGLNKLEKDALHEVDRLLTGIPIYEAWLKDQRGVGPTLAGVLISSIYIEKCNTVSQLWSWCGVGIKNGSIQRRIKGQKAGYNPWLKAKVVKVLGDCMLRANSPYRSFYDDYKHRKVNTLVDVCMACEGRREVLFEDEEAARAPTEKKPRKLVKCPNCKGTGGPAPWGKSDAHRHQASVRRMVKQFLADFWVQWRTTEGLEVRVPYAVEFLNRGHHES